MCGIIGYKGSKNANEVVLEGIKKLEYRGYDSWGIASTKDGKINLAKKVGKIGEIRRVELPISNLAISHTRWATHGGVEDKNAHPHLSTNKTIAVAHNGIIENYIELRAFLKKEGVKFKSETDTEVIPNLIQYYVSTGMEFKDAFVETLKQLDRKSVV